MVIAGCLAPEKKCTYKQQNAQVVNGSEDVFARYSLSKAAGLF